MELLCSKEEILQNITYGNTIHLLYKIVIYTGKGCNRKKCQTVACTSYREVVFNGFCEPVLLVHFSICIWTFHLNWGGWLVQIFVALTSLPFEKKTVEKEEKYETGIDVPK